MTMECDAQFLRDCGVEGMDKISVTEILKEMRADIKHLVARDKDAAIAAARLEGRVDELEKKVHELKGEVIGAWIKRFAIGFLSGGGIAYVLFEKIGLKIFGGQ